jgi:aminoglycoside 6'-N-acetyltransferase I
LIERGCAISMYFRQANTDDIEKVTELAHLLWGDVPYEELREDIERVIQRNTEVIIMALEGEYCIGFAHCALRYDYVEGTSGLGNVGYLEGIYVRENYRKKGIARILCEICGDWARQNGCTEFGSDCEIDNIASYNFHTSIGFTEVNRIVCFVKKL